MNKELKSNNKAVKMVNLTIKPYIQELKLINNVIESGYFSYTTDNYKWLHNRKRNLTKKVNEVKLNFYKDYEKLNLTNDVIKKCLYLEPSFLN